MRSPAQGLWEDAASLRQLGAPEHHPPNHLREPRARASSSFLLLLATLAQGHDRMESAVGSGEGGAALPSWTTLVLEGGREASGPRAQAGA